MRCKDKEGFRCQCLFCEFLGKDTISEHMKGMASVKLTDSEKAVVLNVWGDGEFDFGSVEFNIRRARAFHRALGKLLESASR